MVELRERCADAGERGRQVWAASEYAAFRLALEAPGSFAGSVVGGGAGRHTPGPLWEVAASTHKWAELDAYLAAGPDRSLAVAERVLRGEDLTGVVVDHDVLELPRVVLEWEPRYEVAEYRDDGVDAPEPKLPALVEEWRAAEGGVVDHPATEALYELARPWVDDSNGDVKVSAVSGPAPAAAAALVGEGARAAPMTVDQALSWMAWTGASGGAYGRRRGGAIGRFNAWWTVAEIAGLDWPPEADALAAAARRLHWYRYGPAPPPSGWAFHLAVEDPDASLAWAVAATDAEADGL